MKDVLILMAVLAALAGCKGGHDGESEPELPVVQVSVEEIREEHVGSQIEVVGTVRAVEHASIASRVSGQIVELPVVLGSRVQQGDLLVRISAAELTAQALQTQAQLEQARRNLEREQRLQQQEASTTETVKSLQDLAKIAEAAHKEVTSILGYTTITAPFTGIITRKIANVGDLASPGMVLLELENENLLQVVAQVPEGLIIKVRQGDILPVFIPVAGLRLNGVVAEIAPVADPASRTTPVKINITADAALRPGQFARVILNGSEEQALAVSEQAVRSFGQMEQVFLVTDEGAARIARLRLVRTGARYNGQVEILAGLALGDLVVVRSASRLQDGQPVAVTAAALEEERPRGADGPVPTTPGMENRRPQATDGPVPTTPGMENRRP
jgi:RND family efflux transporter MFP subunit